MTIYDYITRAYVQAHLPNRPGDYRPLADRLRKEGEIVNPENDDAVLLRQMADAGIIAHSSNPRYLSTDPNEGPAGTDHVFFIPATLTLRVPYEAPHCPACEDANALRIQVTCLRQRIADLEEGVREKQCVSLAS